MTEKRTLNLLALTGDAEARLEVEVMPNSDIYVGMKGQNTEGKSYYVQAQMPNPVNGGGDSKAYYTLTEIFNLLEKTIK